MNNSELEAVRLQNIAEAKAEIAAAELANDHLHAIRRVTIASLIDARYKQHLTQAALAERAGLPQSTIARIEAGRGNPTLDTLLTIAKALGVNLVVE